MKRVSLSKDFYLDEFRCRDGVSVPDDLLPNLRRLVEGVLQPLRVAWDAPLIIVSGYRTAKHNKGVGGARASRHLLADGADVRPISLADVPKLHALALRLRQEGPLQALGGLGRYPGWIHVDVRPTLRLVRWGGTGEGSEVA